MDEVEQRRALTVWIKNNIQKNECCSYSETDYTDEAIKPEDVTGHTQGRVSKMPTDAFGDIFRSLGKKTGKYARVSADTPSETLYQLLTEQWKLSPPNLLISVTGGAKNFDLKSHLKKVFHRGLIKMVQTTGAWIITGGTHTGVMKHVGQAVRDYGLSNSMQGKIVAIGVATWGIIHNRNALVNEEGCFPADYAIETQDQGDLACLDNNHTHFLLVDDGTNGVYGREIELRARLEKYISGKHIGNEESDITIPVVCVVLDGGLAALNTIHSAMMNDTPCVILEGSGRIADVIAQASREPHSKDNFAPIQQLLKKFFSHEEYEKFTEDDRKKIQEIINRRHLLTIFNASEEDHRDLDMAILQALLNVPKTGESQEAESRRKLELAIAWNRVDLAKTEIFTEESQWKSEALHWAMTSALVGKKPEFVSLLLENGVILGEYLKKEGILLELYKQLPNCYFFHKLAERVTRSCPVEKKWNKAKASDKEARNEVVKMIELNHVSAEVRNLLGNFTKELYPDHQIKDQTLFIQCESFCLLGNKKKTVTEESGDNSEKPQRDAGSDLFLWAVVQNNKELAEIAWKQCSDCVAAALAASKILNKMATEESDAIEVNDMKGLADQYKAHAIGVFSECHRNNDKRAQKLLNRISSIWGKTTCLRLALETDDKNFVAHSGVQALLTQIWCGKLSADNPVWKLLICMVFFPLIYMNFLVFSKDKRKTKKNVDLKAAEKATGSTSDINRQQDEEPLNCWSKLEGLYCAPQVKFYANIVSYFAFLFLFAVVLITDFQSTPSLRELVLYVWVFSLICEEVRQVVDNPDSSRFCKKAKMYIKELWNILDVLSILLFCLGLVFRLTTELFYPGKIILCIDFVVFCLRLMAIFTISRTLGPKIIIVKKMIMDMFFFMFLLSIWVVAYGVAKQGILIHNESRLSWIIQGAIYEPYLIIFGNFPKDIDNSDFSIDSCSMNGTDPLKPKCPVLNENQMPAFPEWLNIIMLCVYLLFVNILLLNLLIAIFNFTFQEVHENTDEIWKFQRYELIKEYYRRPATVPPLNIYSVFHYFYLKIRRRNKPRKRNEFKIQLKPEVEKDLLHWEGLMKDRYLLSARQEQSQRTETCILDTSQRVTILNEELEKKTNAMLRRLEKLEEQVTQSTTALQQIVDILKPQSAPAKESQPQTSTVPDDSSVSQRNAEQEEDSRFQDDDLLQRQGTTHRES